jgi:hypothetical protein
LSKLLWKWWKRSPRSDYLPVLPGRDRTHRGGTSCRTFWNNSAIAFCVSQTVSRAIRLSSRVRLSSVW